MNGNIVKRLSNAALVTSIWLLPIIFASSFIDQMMPRFKKKEKRSRTILLTILQVVLSFFVFEGFENAIRFFNRDFVKFVKTPDVVNGAILIGVLQSNTQKTLAERINVLYNMVGKLMHEGKKTVHLE